MALNDTPGAPCWVDLMTSDQEAAAAFYGALFGWTIDDPGQDYGGYKNFELDGRHVGGLMQATPDMGVADVWSVYLLVDDAEATVAAAVAAGSAVHVPAMDVMDLGRMAVITDPGGATVGIWEQGTHQGFGVLAEPGAASWFELHTPAYDAVVPFYRDVFKWDAQTMADEPGFRYTTLGKDEDAKAGIMDTTGHMSEAGPPCWSIYFEVSDTDASIERITELGGSVVMGAQDTPYGRLAVVKDPFGAQFNLMRRPLA